MLNLDSNVYLYVFVNIVFALSIKLLCTALLTRVTLCPSYIG